VAYRSGPTDAAEKDSTTHQGAWQLRGLWAGRRCGTGRVDILPAFTDGDSKPLKLRAIGG
jgi:hypothetical protein